MYLRKFEYITEKVKYSQLSQQLGDREGELLSLLTAWLLPLLRRVLLQHQHTFNGLYNFSFMSLMILQFWNMFIVS